MVISVIAIGLPWVPNIPDMSGDKTAAHGINFQLLMASCKIKLDHTGLDNGLQ